ALQATNTWDWLTYFLLGILGLFFAMWLRRNPLCRQTLVGYAGQIVTFVAASGVFALPFTTYWATAYLGSNAIQSFTGTKTPIWAYLDMNGIFIFILVSFLIWQTARLLRRVYVRDLAGRGKWLVLLVAAIGLTLLAAIFMTVAPLKIWLFSLPIPLALLCLPLFVWCGILFLMPDQSRELRVIYALTGLALAISLGVEVVVLGADIGRQNTFFKFYLQIWMLLSVCAGVALAWLLTAAWNWRPVTRVLWLTATALLLALGGLYPIMSTQGKIAMRMAFNAPHSLDGDAYMPFATYYEGSVPIPMADDLKMIRWFQDNVSGTPVILETHEYPSEYKWDGRISINTGLPTILGWRFHQQQQRTVDPLPNLVVQRALNVSAMYNNTDVPTVWNMLQFYHVQYIVVGKLERAVFAPEGLAKFDQMAERGLLKVVYENAGDHIYYVVPGASLPAVNVGG
ncbi:MAG TPA: DUF2298 domain-containing protein, partial [Aggregatilineales bacterium]|nr:DUF2298 domain-containing protein [Aggregatilineales bacterium]